ncbi:efflux RND transporter periplasmic adaptor subunit [Geomonas sp. Red32]|uniref:efflux RND transporter periplasmic adaptor subunit n=1 Tax=Geomonas sp. Red32 TaxID=2912856 RepID=UPI00202CEAB2|nr:efflux RND transporter periplasmic adaptor subunit [Geomonas sp. Red32]MCM0084073.1 efflux RND transporter periplasmic adaptor subunit [Geomonas sp. Red32]
MSRLTSTILVLLLVGTAFIAGRWVSHGSLVSSAADGKKILFYVDPMHPSYHSDKPGVAPDCGMPLEPVYEDGSMGGGDGKSLPPGAIQVSAQQLQTIGVKLATVERSSARASLRLPGRVVPDERRVYRVTAAVDGWVQQVGEATTGSAVRKNETLLSFYAPEFLSAIQTYVYALSASERAAVSRGSLPAAAQEYNDSNLQTYRNALLNLGMSEAQLAEMARTRKATESVRLVSPGSGIVLSRNVSPGQKLDKGSELYRIADLSHVWVLADLYGDEAERTRPGTKVTVSIPNRNLTLTARVSSVEPIFDGASRTTKLRLELDNPGNVLRPDMFVDVELPLGAPAMVGIPSEALLDTGTKKIVYVLRSEGVFEPREVVTGRSFGGRVEILAGVTEGEKIAASGTFLLDSESRMKLASAQGPATHIDPVCGMAVDEAKARADGHFLQVAGTTYYFCSDDCKKNYLRRSGPSRAAESHRDDDGRGHAHEGMNHRHGAMNRHEAMAHRDD